jgi:hypothetical protein
MIIQTAPAGRPRLAVMMHEHTALAHQFARGFGNDRFQAAEPNDLMFHVVLHHDAGWAEFDRNPATDQTTGLPYNLVETPAEYITVTSRLSPEFNQRQHPFCGLISSLHSWGLYNGRYGLSSMVLIDKIPPQDRPLAQRMLAGELDRQKRLKAELAENSTTSAWTSIGCSRTTSSSSSSTRSRSISIGRIPVSAAKRSSSTCRFVPSKTRRSRFVRAGLASMSSRRIRSRRARRSLPMPAVTSSRASTTRTAGGQMRWRRHPRRGNASAWSRPERTA